MSTGFIVYIMIQFAASIVLIYGYMHEKQVIAFEDKIWAGIHAALHSKKGRAPAEKKREVPELTLISEASYTPSTHFPHVA